MVSRAGSARSHATLSTTAATGTSQRLLAACLEKPDPGVEQPARQVVSAMKDQVRVLLHTAQAWSSTHRTVEKGVYNIYTLHHTAVIAFVVLANVFAYSRHATYMYSSLSHSVGHRDAILICRTRPRHKAVVLAYQSHVRMLCQILRRYIHQQLGHRVASGQLTVRQEGNILWVLMSPKNKNAACVALHSARSSRPKGTLSFIYILQTSVAPRVLNP